MQGTDLQLRALDGGGREWRSRSRRVDELFLLLDQWPSHVEVLLTSSSTSTPRMVSSDKHGAPNCFQAASSLLKRVGDQPLGRVW
jgi:hypothetical protein